MTWSMSSELHMHHWNYAVANLVPVFAEWCREACIPSEPELKPGFRPLAIFSMQ